MKMKYMDIEYTIRGRGRNKWQWNIYPQPPSVKGTGGEIEGGRDKAIRAAKGAIHELLKERERDADT